MKYTKYIIHIIFHKCIYFDQVTFLCCFCLFAFAIFRNYLYLPAYRLIYTYCKIVEEYYFKRSKE